VTAVDTLGETGGDTTHTHDLGNHVHGTSTVTSGTNSTSVTGRGAPGENVAVADDGHTHTLSGNTDVPSSNTSGSGSSYPPYQVVNWIIAT
jgi:hypothetical protein